MAVTGMASTRRNSRVTSTRPLTELPGDHTGCWSHPAEFAAALVDVLV